MACLDWTFKKRDLFTISYISSPTFFVIKRKLHSWLFSKFHCRCLHYSNCTAALLETMQILSPSLFFLVFFSVSKTNFCWFIFLLDFLFQNQRLRWCYKPLPSCPWKKIILSLLKTHKGNIFQSFFFPLLQIYDSKTKAIKISLPSLIIQPLDWYLTIFYYWWKRNMMKK